MKRFVLGTAAAAAVLVVAGCAGEQVRQIEPRLELRSAAQHLAEAQQAGFTVKLAGSTDDLIAALELQAKDDKSDDAFDAASDTDTIRKLVNSSFTISYDKGGDGEADDRSSVAATVDGVTGTELRFADDLLYVKAPVAELAKQFGAGDVSTLSKDAPPELKPFFDGKWVSVDPKEATALSGATAGVPTGDVDSAKTLAEVQKSATNLLEGADIVRDGTDKTHLTVTSSTTKAYAELQRLLTAVNPELTGALDKETGEAPKERPIVIDLWVENDKFVAAEINVLQFIDGAAGRAAVRIEVTTGAAIDVPEGAKKLDLSALTKK